MDKTDFVKQLATLESLTDWEDGDAVLEALDTTRREIYIQYRTGKMNAEEFRALNLLAGCLEHRALDSMIGQVERRSGSGKDVSTWHSVSKSTATSWMTAAP